MSLPTVLGYQSVLFSYKVVFLPWHFVNRHCIVCIVYIIEFNDCALTIQACCVQCLDCIAVNYNIEHAHPIVLLQLDPFLDHPRHVH